MEMRYLKNEHGMALVMALVLAVVTLTFSAALIFMVTQGTKMSGLEKRYATALDAAKGGIEIITETIDLGGDTGNPSITINNESCLDEKLYKKAPLWNYSTDNATELSTGPCGNHAQVTEAKFEDPEKLPDITYFIGSGEQTYKLYLKITDTVEGNSQPIRGGGGGGGIGRGSKVEVSAVVGGGSNASSSITPMHMPYLYKINVLSRRVDPNLLTPLQGDSAARMVVLYAH